MSTKSRLPALCALLASMPFLAACSGPGEQAGDAMNAPPPMDSLVSAEWLEQHLDDPDLVILDCTVLIEQDENGGLRSVNGRDNYLAGHIPSAGFADLMGDLSDPESPFEFAMPAPVAFVDAMSKLGVSDNSRVVLYDTFNSAWAARVWWMLRWIGFDNAALLDGGLSAWTAGDRPLSNAPATPAAGTLTLALRPELFVDQDEVRASRNSDSVTLIDSMPDSHYRGDWTMYARPGHITGAYSMPSSLLADEAGQFRSHDELDLLFDVDRNNRTITYCGGGIAAASNAFALTRLGFKDVAVYDASLQEWALDPDNPMETGSN